MHDAALSMTGVTVIYKCVGVSLAYCFKFYQYESAKKVKTYDFLLQFSNFEVI